MGPDGGRGGWDVFADGLALPFNAKRSFATPPTHIRSFSLHSN